MTMTRTLVGALLASTAIIMPATGWAQQNTAPLPPQPVEEIVVTGRNIPNEKRATSEIANILDAESFRTTGDSNLSEALQRVTGISSDGGFVIVRGLNERYSQVLVNGVNMPSNQPLQRAVPLDIFPTGLISGVLVQKTWSPQFPGDFGGGLVELRTLAVPEEEFIDIGISGTWNSATTGERGLTFQKGEADWTGFDISGDFSLPDNFPENKAAFDALTPAEREVVAERLGNDWSILDRDVPLSGSGSLTYGNRFDVGSESSIGFIAAIDYDNGWQNKNGVRRGVTTGTNVEIDYSPEACAGEGDPDGCGYRETEQTIDLNGLASLGFEFDASNVVRATTFLLRKTTKQALIEQGDDIEGSIVQASSKEWLEEQTWSNQLTGEHDIDLGGPSPVVLEWRGAYSESLRELKDRREFEYFWDEQDRVWRFSNISNANNDIYFGDLDDITYEAGADLLIPTEISSLLVDFRIGAAYYRQERDSATRQFGFLGPFNNDELREQVPEVIFGPINVDPNGFRLTEKTSPSDAFTAEIENYQYYAQFDAQVLPTLRLAGGVRYEDFEQTATTFARSVIPCTDIRVRGTNPPRCAAGGSTAYLPDEQIDALVADDVWLPAATATWEFMPDHQLRVGFSQTLNRPSLRELSTSPFRDPDTNEPVSGNPLLRAAELNNYDARWEWYFSQQEFLTVGVFYKDIKNPIEIVFNQVGSEFERQFINGDKAEVYGVEAEIEIGLPVADWWSALGTREFFVRANATYANSEASVPEGVSQLTEPTHDLQGQSDFLGNIQLGWRDEVEGERFALLLNYTGERIESLGFAGQENTLEEPPLLLDAVYAREFEMLGGRYEVTLEARNLLNESYKLTKGPITTLEYDLGVTVQAGISISY
ncbi:TonB-dependent receptor domain-containing protein [Indioceanicola profundi]|uniref:TonB-dependent receptor domain-containing protein n=1 Tax=Indioceanicola profundi TaxID=2220096 RepID=UPI000E6AD748|nr:TonB-dependent receptor [Indioceanicola profundi]